MSFCASCGTELDEGMKFCPACGAVAKPAAVAEAPGPGAAPFSQGGDPQIPDEAATQPPRPVGWDWLSILRGNWLGAAIVALTTALCTGLLGIVLALLAKPEDFGVNNTLTLATLIATGAFGADARGEVTSTGIFEVTGGGSVGWYPFTVTLVALVVAVVMFRKVTRSYTSDVHALSDAVRTAILFGICLWIPALIFTSNNDDLGGGWGTDVDAGALGADIEIGAEPSGALFLGFLIMSCVLLASVVVRQDFWNTAIEPGVMGTWMRRFREWISAPFAGLVTLALLLPVAGAIGLLAVLLFGEDNNIDVSGGETGLQLSVYIALLANFGMWALALGSGSRFGFSAQVDGAGSEQEWTRLWGQITEAEPGLWISPFLLVLVLALSVVVVLRRSSPADAVRSLAIWVGTLLLAVPLLVRVTGLHASGQIEATDGEAYGGTLYFGPDGLQTTALLILIAAVIAFIAVLVTGALSPQTVRSNVGKVGRGLQRPEPLPSDNAGETRDH